MIVLLGPPRWLEMLLSAPMVLSFWCLVVVAIAALRDLSRSWSGEPGAGEDPFEDRRAITFGISFVGLAAFVLVAMAALLAALAAGRAAAVSAGLAALLFKVPGLVMTLAAAALVVVAVIRGRRARNAG